MTAETCRATEVWFPAGTVLDHHRHDRSIFAVMLSGSFETSMRGRFECTPSVVWTEPAEERHANYVGSLGARVLVVQPDPACADLFERFHSVTHAPVVLRNAIITADAHRITRELAIRDTHSAMAIDSLVMTMMTAAVRAEPAARVHDLPVWLERAREMVRAHFRDGLRLAAVAAEVGVHPSHLAHEFRRRFRVSLGEYARQLRLEWAVSQLGGHRSLAEIALDAGYSDQAHFTRHCSRTMGASPAQLRARGR